MFDFIHVLRWAWARLWDERIGRIKPDTQTPHRAARGIDGAARGIQTHVEPTKKGGNEPELTPEPLETKARVLPAPRDLSTDPTARAQAAIVGADTPEKFDLALDRLIIECCETDQHLAEVIDQARPEHRDNLIYLAKTMRGYTHPN